MSSSHQFFPLLPTSPPSPPVAKMQAIPSSALQYTSAGKNVVLVQGHPDDIIAASRWLHNHPLPATQHPYLASDAYNANVFPYMALPPELRNPTVGNDIARHRAIWSHMHNIAAAIETYYRTGEPVRIMPTRSETAGVSCAPFWVSLLPQLEFVLVHELAQAPLATFDGNAVAGLTQFTNGTAFGPIDGVMYELDLPTGPQAVQDWWLRGNRSYFTNVREKVLATGGFGGFGRDMRLFDGYGTFHLDPAIANTDRGTRAGVNAELPRLILVGLKSVLDGGLINRTALRSFVLEHTGRAMSYLEARVLTHIAKKLYDDGADGTNSITSPKQLVAHLGNWDIPGTGGVAVVRMRGVFAKCKDDWSTMEAFLTQTSSSPAITDNALSNFLTVHGPWDFDLLLAKSLGHDEEWLQGVPPEELCEMHMSNSAAIQKSGCARDGCYQGPNGLSRPEYGFADPYSPPAAQRRLCVSDFREALAMKEVLGFDKARYDHYIARESVLLVDGSGTFKEVMGFLLPCEGLHCDGAAFPMVGPNWHATDGYPLSATSISPFISLCTTCQRKEQVYIKLQMEALKTKAEAAGGVHNLHPDERIVRGYTSSESKTKAICGAKHHNNRGCRGVVGTVDGTLYFTVYDRDGAPLCKPCGLLVPGLITTPLLSTLRGQARREVRDNIANILSQYLSPPAFIKALEDNVYAVPPYAVIVSAQLALVRDMGRSTPQRVRLVREACALLNGSAADDEE